METRKKVASIAFTGAAATLAVGMTTPQAMAATTWHIKNGTAGYTGSVKGKNVGNTTLKDTTTGATLTCTSATAAGNIPASTVTGSSPAVANVGPVNFTHCTLGTIAFTAKTLKTMPLHAGTFAGGVTTGFLGTTGAASAISASITGVGNACKAKIIGATVPGTYHNTSHELIANSHSAATLTVKTATSCGLLHTGDHAFFKGTFKITTPTSLTISS